MLHLKIVINCSSIYTVINHNLTLSVFVIKHYFVEFQWPVSRNLLTTKYVRQNKRLLSRGPLVPVCLVYAEIFGPWLFFDLFALMAIELRLRKLAITLIEILVTWGFKTLAWCYRVPHTVVNSNNKPCTFHYACELLDKSPTHRMIWNTKKVLKVDLIYRFSQVSWAGLFKARSYPRIKRELLFEFCIFAVPSVLGLSYLKIRKTKAEKNSCIQETFMLRLIFNAGLALYNGIPDISPRRIQWRTSTW